MKTNYYKIDNTIEKIFDDKYTLFLDEKELSEVKSKLKKHKYNIYYPYKDSEKVILYTDQLPSISLIKITSFNKLRHQDILGSLLSLNISKDYFGDIIVDNDNYYFYVFSNIKDYVINNLISIGKYKVTLEEIDLLRMADYERKYEKKEIIVSSLRIDNVLAKIIGTNRENILSKIKNKEVILNYEVLNKGSYILKENDIFSVRKYGKYKFANVINNTKKGNLIILYLKYI